MIYEPRHELYRDKHGNIVWFNTSEKAHNYIKKHKIKNAYPYYSFYGELGNEKKE